MTPDLNKLVLLLGGALDEDHDFRLPAEERGFGLESNLVIQSEDEIDIRIEEAVISLCRACFTRGVPLVFKHDPVVTPLALELARSYWQPLPGEQSVENAPRSQLIHVWQGEAVAEDQEILERAEGTGYAKMLTSWDLTATNIWRVVCIGGGRVSQNDVKQLVRTRHPSVFAIASTGVLAEALQGHENILRWEQNFWEGIARQNVYFRPPETPATLVEPPATTPLFRYSLYPLLMDIILDEEATATTPRFATHLDN
jgi:hypothetical protein